MVARDGERHHQGDQAGDQRGGAREVDVADGRGGAHVGHRDEHEENRDQANRQVDVEHPAPAEVIGDVAAEDRADDRRKPENPTE